MKTYLFLLAALAMLAFPASSAAHSDGAGFLCGNGLIDRPAEECDYNAFEYYGVENNGCPEGQLCSRQCRCLQRRKVMRYRRSAPPESIRRFVPELESEPPSRAAPPAPIPAVRMPDQPGRAN